MAGTWQACALTVGMTRPGLGVEVCRGSAMASITAGLAARRSCQLSAPRAGEVVPASLADNLTRLIAEGTGEEDEGADEELRAGAVEAYLELLERPKLPPVLLKVGAWRG